MEDFIKKILRSLNLIIIKPKDSEEIQKLKKQFPHNERSFVYGGIKYLVDSLYCHASPGVIETVILEIKKLKDTHAINGNKLLNVGGGKTSEMYASVGYDIYTIDIDVPTPDEKNIYFDLNDAKSIPFPDKSFDVIVCQEVIEHIQNPWKIFIEAKRLLKDNGVLIVTTPNLLSLQSKLLFLFTGYFKWFTPECFDYHINPIPIWELELIAQRNNFCVYATKGGGDYFFHRNNTKRKSIIKNNETLISFFTKEKEFLNR